MNARPHDVFDSEGDLYLCFAEPEGGEGLPAFVSGCHYCRIASAGRVANRGDEWLDVFEPLASVMGLEPGAEVLASESLRAAAVLADDAAVLRMLDRLGAPA